MTNGVVLISVAMMAHEHATPWCATVGGIPTRSFGILAHGENNCYMFAHDWAQTCEYYHGVDTTASTGIPFDFATVDPYEPSAGLSRYGK